MPQKSGKRDKTFYQDVSRITLEGLSEITHDFEEFYKELANRFQPGLQDAADQELPEASDQLNAIVETTESATTKIMDTLEEMQDEQENARRILAELVADKRMSPSKRNALAQAVLALDSNQNRIMTIFEELSFQDLTGQRIKRIVTLVKSVEEKVHGILDTLGKKVPAGSASKPNQTQGQPELKGPQKPGEGLDQSAIDDLLANL
jgi:chemotaxis protein CheZ